jgi:acyl-CoA synthetase (AMP-forming)/AMP-acid ligase II
LRKGTPPLDVSELEAFANEHLTGYQRPAHYRVVDALPRTPSMKVSQPQVRQLFLDAD